MVVLLQSHGSVLCGVVVLRAGHGEEGLEDHHAALRHAGSDPVNSGS